MSSISNAQQQVRLGNSVDELDILVNYLDGVTCIADLLPSNSDKFSVYQNAVEVLYETMCDPMVSQHWRYSCLAHLYKPLLKAERYARSGSDRIALARIKIDMHLLVPYFL